MCGVETARKTGGTAASGAYTPYAPPQIPDQDRGQYQVLRAWRSTEADRQGVDGLVFVWDSRSRRLRENVGSFLEAREAVEACGCDWRRLPRGIQLNKQGLPPLTPRADIDAVLDRLGERGPRIASVATDGVGVVETLAAIACGVVRGKGADGTFP